MFLTQTEKKLRKLWYVHALYLAVRNENSWRITISTVPFFFISSLVMVSKEVYGYVNEQGLFSYHISIRGCNSLSLFFSKVILKLGISF